MPKFSIIIPVYNVAPYLRECLDSVVNQTFLDWEAICVNDGSTDESGEILDEYVVRDNRIKVIHKKNEGVSITRNVGFKASHGETIIFMDGDDQIPSNYLEAHLHVRENEGYALTFSPYIRLYDDGHTELADSTYYCSSNKMVDFAKSILSNMWCPIIHAYAWPRKVIESGGLWRTDIISYDDVEFAFRHLPYCSKALAVNSVRAIYRKHSGGLSNLPASDRICDYFLKANESRECIAFILEDSASMRYAVAQMWFCLLMLPIFCSHQAYTRIIIEKIRRLQITDFKLLEQLPLRRIVYKLFGLNTLVFLLRIQSWCKRF